MEPSSSDQDFIFGLIEYLFTRHDISFHISSKDFDVLYQWWEKGIPGDLIRRSMDTVVLRRRQRGKPVESFMNFSYEVKKNLGVRFQLNINTGAEAAHPDPAEREEEFIRNLHPDLEFLKEDFNKLIRSPSGERDAVRKEIFDRIIERYGEDSEMVIRTEIFTGNLPEPMRKPAVIRKFRENFLSRKYRIPDFGSHEEEKNKA